MSEAGKSVHVGARCVRKQGWPIGCEVSGLGEERRLCGMAARGPLSKDSKEGGAGLWSRAGPSNLVGPQKQPEGLFPHSFPGVELPFQ